MLKMIIKINIIRIKKSHLFKSNLTTSCYHNLFLMVVNQQSMIKHELSHKLKNQMRKTPELLFFIDNSFEHYQNINEILKDI